MNLWIKDPKTQEASVSLSLLVITFVGTIGAAVLHMADVVKDTSVMSEMFYANLALYFGRRFNIGNKTISSEKTE